MPKQVTRLIRQFVPEHYDLSLTVDQKNRTFSGTVRIQGNKVGRPNKRLTFHQNGLQIISASVQKHDKKNSLELAVSRINLHKTRQEVRIHFEEQIYPGAYDIELHFNGKLSDAMHGIYPCYFEHEGQKLELIATQFESHHAREAFPCIDEPEAKATFQLCLTTPKVTAVLSNTDPEKQEESQGQLHTTFAKTPRMSTYLLAFVYGDMTYMEGFSKNNIRTRVWASAAQNKENLSFALNTAIKLLDHFEDYYDTPYPLKKIDHIALPDFSEGAMENWGLITYRETGLVISEASSIESKQGCALVIAHELSHQWFGNLVTMRWWDDLWLNESFASLMEFMATDKLFPEWKMWELYTGGDVVRALRRDSLPSVQAVRTKVHHPDQIATLFDPAIVYAKGGALIHMLYHIIGDDAFRQGLTSYFAEHAYSNTTAEDLWSSFAKTCDFDVSLFMHQWLDRPGYPVVEISFDPEASTALVSQQRFLNQPISNESLPQTWRVPLASNYELHPAMIEGEDTTCTVLTSPDSNEPLLLNYNSRSFFITHYLHEKHWQQIKQAIEKRQINSLNRSFILDNYLLLQRGGKVQTKELIELIESYKNEDEEAVWSSIAAIISDARRLVAKTPAEAHIKRYIAHVASAAIDMVGWQGQNEDESAQRQRLRGLLLTLGAIAEVREVIDEGLRRFHASQNFDTLPGDIRDVVLYIASRYGTSEDFELLLSTYKSSQNAELKSEILGALVTTRDQKQIDTLISLLKTPNVRSQDLHEWFILLLYNAEARQKIWDWMVQEWPWILQTFSGDQSHEAFAQYSAMAFSTENELNMYQTFFGQFKDDPVLSRAITLGFEDISGRVKWRQQNEQPLIQWLQDWASNAKN